MREKHFRSFFSSSNMSSILILLAQLSVLIYPASSVILTPPYFNLVANKRVTATATCGEGVSEPELYCKLTGSTATDRESYANLIQGQYCDYCDPNRPEKTHPAEYAIDGTEKWWQSPPLSRSLDFNQVNLTIDLGQEFHVAYIYIKMANSPRPGVWALEKSNDDGKTYHPWQYFADTPSDCYNIFGVEANKRISKDDDVICTTDYSKVLPVEGGEILLSLVNNRPNSKNFTHSDVLQTWTRATNVRLRLMRTKNLLGHLMAVAKQDPTVTRRYFYSIRDISIGGRCVCNGHAQYCDESDPENPNKLVCRCSHNTCGDQCQECCPGFVQKPWRQNRENQEFECEPCQCFGHSDECEYDPEIDAKKLSIDIHGEYSGGGRCLNCDHNTEGINCEKCKQGYYRPFDRPINATDACQRCDCNNPHSTGNCAEGTGQCECKPQYDGRSCDRCAEGYTDYPLCRPCDCHPAGRADNTCIGKCKACKFGYLGPYCNECVDRYYGFPNCTECKCDSEGRFDFNCDKKTGQCICRQGYKGLNCDQCENGYYGDRMCQPCDCDPAGTTEEICNKSTGQCICGPNYAGERCNECAPGFYNFPSCLPCECSEDGSLNKNCTFLGVKQCFCKLGRGGPNCDSCAPGYYQFPECIDCQCDEAGSIGKSCDPKTGKCKCKANFVGDKCSECAPNLYNYPICEECRCHPDGVLPEFPGCSKELKFINGIICPCKEYVTGRQCDECKDRYYGLGSNPEKGCTACECSRDGTLNELDICDQQSGQCHCKLFAGSSSCSECKPGSYSLKRNDLFGCEPCGCRVGASVDNNCDIGTGECRCLPNIVGEKCDRPAPNHFIPSLHQQKFEIENGYTPSNKKPVRYGFDESVFPEFSWKGYVNLNKNLGEVAQDIRIEKAGTYRMVLRYINKNANLTDLSIRIKQANANGDEQSTVMFLPPNQFPAFTTVTLNQVAVLTIELERADYVFSFQGFKDRLLLDYFVLLPSDYYESSVLVEKVEKACEDYNNPELCIQYKYVSIDSFPFRGLYSEDSIDSNRLVDLDQLKEFNHTHKKPLLAAKLGAGESLTKVIKVAPNVTNYALLLDFMNLKDDGVEVNVEITHLDSNRRQYGKVYLYKCNITSLCREVVLSNQVNEPLLIDAKDSVKIQLTSSNRGDNSELLVYQASLVPKDKFNINLIKMAPYCIVKDKSCTPLEFSQFNSHKIEMETGSEDYNNRQDIYQNVHQKQPVYDYIPTNKVVYLNGFNYEVTIPVQAARRDYGDQVILLVHYYQPNHPTVNVSVNLDRNLKGSFQANYCPSMSGCRSIVSFEASGETFSNPDFRQATFTLAQNTKDIWLDYMLLAPASAVNPEVFESAPVDLTPEFIAKCASQHFDVITDTSKFCEDAVFSLSAKYNNGAQACSCDPDGTKDGKASCEYFGGQCDCKENIIGRECSKCKTGYYGFPNCRKCDCNSGNCDDQTGKCICPPNVEEGNCDTCVDGTYAFHSIYGCEECNCDLEGTENRNPNCDKESGQCFCKPNMDGQRCDRCKAGFYNYPYCYECQCDRNGTTDQICDAVTAQCICKENVVGDQCNMCNHGTFNLEGRNPKGCSKCFCFGMTDRCISSPLYFRKVNDLSADGWTLTNAAGKQLPDLEIRKNSEDSSELSLGWDREALKNTKLNEPVYWNAPKTYINLVNKVGSYGGSIRYIIRTLVPEANALSVIKPDLILVGQNMTLAHVSIKQPADNELFENSIDLLESEFKHASSGSSASREQLMMVLASLKEIKLRATYYNHLHSSDLVGFEMDEAVASYEPNADESRPALSAERCGCPENYAGFSCESCADGFYKVKSNGPGLFNCVPCNCSGHSNVCDQETGDCIDCQDNTQGKNCESCKHGHYSIDLGNGRNECRLCPCPGPSEQNNFADSCMYDQNSNRVYHCSCLPGYTGQYCERCSPGYYGDPTVPGGKCLPCECNGNIDLRDFGSCDQRTGACLKCLYNTTGRACDKCLPEHFGNPLDKTCQKCDCDLCGTETCNVKTGECICKRNVTGLRCSSCGENMYGFNSCNGCLECDCDPVGSTSTQCNFLNGQCSCKPGVTGRRCDQCQSDYWSFSENGCLKCNCDKDGVVYGTNGYKCDNKTGDCTCIPGVKGKYCDECDDKWVLVRGKGCVECDQCVVTLLGDAAELEMKADAIEHGNKNSSLTFKAHNKLVKLENDFSTLKSNIDPSAYDNTQLLNIQRTIQRIQKTDLPSLSLMTTFPINEMVKTLKALLNDAELFNSDINELRVKLDALDKLVKELDREDYNKMKNLTDEQLLQYEQIVDMIAKKNLSSSLGEYNQLVEKFHLANRTVQSLIRTFNTQMESADSIKNKNAYIQKSLIELKHLIDKAKSLEKFQDKDISFKVYYESLDQTQNETNVLKANSLATVKTIEALIKDAQSSLTAAGAELANLNDKIADLKGIYKDHERKIQELRQKCNQAENRAHELMAISNSWKNKVAKSQEGIVAFEMAQAYVKIANTLKSANEKSVSVLKQYTSANENLEELLKKADQLKSSCSELAEDAKEEIAKKFDAEIENENLNSLYGQLEKKTKQLSKNLDKVDQWINRTYTSDQTLTYLKNQLDSQQVELKKNQETADDLIRKIQSLDSLKNSLPKPEGVAIDGASGGGGEKLLESIEASMDSLRKAGPSIDESINKLLQDNNFNSELDQIKNDIYDLKLLISSTRDIVNEIKVAVNFNDSTVISLKPSADLQPSLSTTGSLYLQTRDSYAPIAFIYNESNPSEYVSLYLQSGRPFFQYRLAQNAPPVTLMADLAINNGQWHRVDIERIGQRSKLSVVSEYGSRENEVRSGENAVVFNIDPNGAKIVLGQFPLDVIPNELKTVAAYNNQFRGAMDDLKLNGHSYGLWNYETARGIKGEPKRPSLSNIEPSPIDGVSEKAVYFMDDSFLCLSNSPITIKRKVGLDVTLKFKTDSPNGLLWIWSNDEKQYIAIYLEAGVINVQLSQSNDFKRSLFDRAPESGSVKLNDNKFHTVHVKILLQDVPFSQQKNGEYMQDLKIIAEERTDPDNTVTLGDVTHKCERRIIVRNGMQCVGGIPANIREGPFKDAQFNSFVGCIGSLLVPSYDFNPIDLGEALLKSDTKAANVAPKCPEAADQCSIKKSATPVYLSFDTSVYDRNQLQETIGIGFVTSNPDGVLVYRAENRNDNSQRILLQLKDRRLVLTVYETVNGETNAYSLNSDKAKQYSDNQLHFAYVIVNETAIKLRVDDQLIAQHTLKANEENQNQIVSSSSLYVAGVPESQRGNLAETFGNFEGCITQLIYNDNQLKFDSASSRSPNGMAFAKCYKTPLKSALASLPAYKQLQQSTINVNRFSQTFSKQKQLQQQQQQSLKNDECALNKQYDTSQLKSVGLRFGLSKRSRLEVHESYPLKITSVVSFKFRTLQPDGLMFYASDAQFFDFIAVWLQDGYVHYAFDCGTGFMHINSKRIYSDGRYHTVTIKRDKQTGLLVLADRSNTTVTETVEGLSGGAANALSVVEPYYFGSIPENEKSQLPASQTDLIVTEPFIGCMSDFNIAYKPLRNKIQKVDLMNCSNNHESGAFFTGHSLTSYASLPSYLALRDAYEIDFEIKSRTKNGVVLYVGPKDIGIDSPIKDFVLLELVDGELVYKANVGGYESTIKYQPELARNELCNSSWIRIKLRKDDKGEMTLELKGVELANSFPAESLSSLALSTKANTVFVGSLPLRSAYAEITQTNEPFIGCIRDMTIKRNSDTPPLSRALLDMNLESGVLNYCPLK